jgi:hypothetical protein
VASRSAGRSKRIFVAFAIEDVWAGNLLRGQSRLGSCPITYTDLSVKVPWDTAWKTRCRTRIRGCDGLIALISSNTRNADGARWEIRCARNEGLPVLGVYVGADRYKPPEIKGKRVITWRWEGIGDFVSRL